MVEQYVRNAYFPADVSIGTVTAIVEESVA
jgi:hypothetical protein